MREVKFRIWDADEKRMYHLLENRFSFGPCEGVRAVSWEDVFAEQHEELTPLQYTGLKDKNGKEIYEGDIVEYGLLTGKIVFESGAFQFEIMKSYHGQLIGECDCLIDLAEDGFEVVGNVFEHSDLLEVAE